MSGAYPDPPARLVGKNEGYLRSVLRSRSLSPGGPIAEVRRRLRDLGFTIIERPDLGEGVER